MRIAVVIPTLDEAESIAAVVGELPRNLIDRVIVADGGSSDGTADRAQRAGSDTVHAGRGYGRACLTGAIAANDADILVFMDGDGADDPRAIERLVMPIASGDADFVIGSRILGTPAPGSMAWHQRLAGRVFGAFIRLCYGVSFTDMCALRAIRRDVLLRLGMTEMTYGWNLEMQLRAARGKLRILEIPVNNRPRIGGASKVAGTVQGSLRAAAQIIATCARVVMSPAPPADTSREVRS